jgi:hypothetical protein
VVYARRLGDGDLTFEASGALEGASLVMRDRETDSWWSVMGGRAIGGPLEGEPLRELPIAEKTTWGAWRRAHPGTHVLSVDGRTHDPVDAYAEYFASERTFGDLRPDDARLDPKTPIFAFRWNGAAHAMPFESFSGGRAFDLADDLFVYLWRDPDSPARAGSRAWRISAALRARLPEDGEAARAIIEAAERAGDEAVRLAGIDTYWYVWAPRNAGTRLPGAR